MKLKLSDSLIERIARFDSIFYNGNILHDSGAVKTINFLKTQNSDAPYEICSIVHDFTGREYHAEADFDTKGNIQSIGCDCPASHHYQSCCIHVVAMLFQAQYEQKSRRISWEDAIVFYQRNTINQLLDQYEDSLVQEVRMNLEDTSTVSLIPKLRFEGEVTKLELSIGTKRFYVIKDLFDFINRIDTQSEFIYGKELTFNHDIRRFDEQSLKILNFVKSIVKDRQFITQQYRLPNSERRSLLLSSMKLRELHDLLLNTKLNCYVEKDEWKSILMTNQRPNIQLKIEQAKNKGLLLKQTKGKMLIRGRGKDYFLLTQDSLWFMDEEFINYIFPILKEIIVMSGYLYISSEQIPHFLSVIYPRIAAFVTDDSINYLQGKYEMPQLDSKVYLDLNDDLAVEAKVEYGYNGHLYNPLTDELPSTIVRDKVKEAQLMNVFETYDFKIDKDKMVLNDDHQIYQFMNQGVPAFNCTA